MGQIVLTVTGNAGVGTRSKTFTVPDAHITRFVDAMRAKYGTNGTPATANVALNAWAENVLANIKTDVRDHESRAAQAAIGEITAT